MSSSFYKPLSSAEKEHYNLVGVVEEISRNMSDQIDELKANLCERELEIQELEAKLNESKNK